MPKRANKFYLIYKNQSIDSADSSVVEKDFEVTFRFNGKECLDGIVTSPRNTEGLSVRNLLFLQ